MCALGMAALVYIVSPIYLVASELEKPHGAHNLHSEMQSLSCTLNSKRDILQMTWRDDTSANRHPGHFEGRGNQIVLQFSPIREIVDQLGDDLAVTVDIGVDASLIVRLRDQITPIKKIFVSAAIAGVRIVRAPNFEESLHIAVDIKAHMSQCIRNKKIEDIEVNRGL